MSVLDEYRAQLADSTARLITTVSALTDADLHAPSLLPGWSRGHVVTHVARSGDSLINLFTWARTGVPTPQYPSMEVRDADIEAGAPRPAKEQLADLEAGAARFDAAAAAMTESDWTVLVSARGVDHPAWYVLMRRLREVEIHHGDLGTGYGWADWPEQYVVWDFHDTMRSWTPGAGPVGEIRVVESDETRDETWTGLGEGPSVTGTRRDLLAWLSGRTSGDRLTASGPLPAPPPWPFQAAPEGLPAAVPDTWPPSL
ncbi:maleylpyruvate isomerase [Acrocarpospora phusangensis]|uniref:Maleylpyruvate isomerase n=1 Tax=Acrocarpospora phusangensis TaxID=1070424 RepID=A0A919URQ4_9ACTN|nr:maleylpyruvate isomerase family mycothiol-dependent enzyme [Acrocarpospora phusangensis]GIH28307.1 maleylpyruvate isomerase [Acrocarpospora phusangensis]